MSSKGYSKQARIEIQNRLLETGLRRYAKEGIKAVNLIDIVKEVGISKPFFYKFFPSLQDFVLEVLHYQWKHLEELNRQLMQQYGTSWQDHVRGFMDVLIHHQNYGILIMTQEEELWVKSKVNPVAFEQFMKDQLAFVQSLLDVWMATIDAKVMTNCILSIALIYNSGKQSFPFFYQDMLEETARLQIESFIAYMEKHRST